MPKVFTESDAEQARFENEPFAIRQITEKVQTVTKSNELRENPFDKQTTRRGEVRTQIDKNTTKETKVGEVSLENIGEGKDTVRMTMTSVGQVGTGEVRKEMDERPSETVNDVVGRNSKDRQSLTKPGPSHMTSKDSPIRTGPKVGKKKAKAKKILFKGDPGTGKTFSRKVAWDWATGLFTAVSVVFFVTMKLAKSGKTIENLIIQQTSVVAALHIGEKRLRGMIESLGSRCLIILEGLDEHDIQKSPHIANVISGRQLLGCNLFVTSRPHNISEFEEHFSTIVQVQGFSKNRAADYLTKILSDKTKVQNVMSFYCQ